MHHPDIAHGNTGECFQTLCDLHLQTSLIQEGSGSWYDLGKCRLLLYPMQLVAWSSSCSHWWFARLVCSFLTACQHAPGMGSLWDQGLALYQLWRAMSHSSSCCSLWLQLCLLHLCLDCLGDGDFPWVHMLWHTSAQPQA